MTTNNGLIITGIGVAVHIFNRALLSLELTNYNPLIDTVDTPGNVDTLSDGLNYVWSSLSSFIQIMSFQTQLPAALNGIIVFGLGIYMLYIMIAIIRGYSPT